LVRNADNDRRGTLVRSALSRRSAPYPTLLVVHLLECRKPARIAGPPPEAKMPTDRLAGHRLLRIGSPRGYAASEQRRNNTKIKISNRGNQMTRAAYRRRSN